MVLAAPETSASKVQPFTMRKLRMLIITPKIPGRCNQIRNAAGEKNSIYSQRHNMTINPVLQGQRFPKPGAHNFRRNKDTVFILIDRYLFFFL